MKRKFCPLGRFSDFVVEQMRGLLIEESVDTINSGDFLSAIKYERQQQLNKLIEIFE
jgi:hypothetical protein